ncbi:MAG: DUF952 domain-containing protein [Chloroflexota bacterium]|nr:DUF952 domain-containing protein [Chloroflexota bacterium]
MIYQTAEESREAGVAYHLVPAPLWQEFAGEPAYVPDSYDADGFIHCTNGLAPLRDVANMFYAGDARDHLVLVLDVTRITSEVRYDDPERIYPHIYGPLNVDAVIDVLVAEQDADGTFIGFRER